VDLARQQPRAWLAARRAAPKHPSPLANTLRRLVKRARLVGCVAVVGERAFRVDFERGGETASLWIELFGPHANLYLVDTDGIVRATPRGAEAARRDASVGSAFTPTPAAEASGPAIDPDQASARIAALADGAVRTGGGGDPTARARRTLKRGRKKTARRLDEAERALERLAEADAWRHKGELLRASFHLLAPGLASVVVPDYATDPPTEVAIELDPNRDPGEQVGLCFQRAKRFERGAEHAERAIEELRPRLAAFDAALAALAALEPGADPADTLARHADALPAPVREELASATAPQPGPKRKGPPPRVPFRSFTSADGWEIRVGKSARDNDELTLRSARPHDLFLHARASPGSHVIVPTPRGKTVPRDTLLDAAELACVFSDRRDAERNEVDYTPRRYVRKAKGAPAGQVVLERSKTLAIRRDDGRRRRLLGRPAP
jgi:predicted ribosome quality control (RQC) complex YloA/Tae2 family protein